LHFPKRDAITVAPGRISIAVGFDLWEEVSRLVRDRLDRDGDGRLSPDDVRAIENHLTMQARRDVRLRVNGEPAQLRVTARQLSGAGDGRGDADSLGIEIVLEGEIARASPLRLEFSDATPERRHDVPVSLAIHDLKVTATSEGRLDVGAGRTQAVRGVQLAPGATLVVELEAGA
jgi:hypothetical protein